MPAGRPLKKGVDFWRFDVDLFDDRRIKLIRGEFGAKGVLIALFALNACYKENGYFKVWEDDDAILLSEELGCGCSPGLVEQVIRACVARSLFDGRVFGTHHVLTSSDIQRRYVQIVAKNRYNIPLCEEYWLIPQNEIPADALSKCTFFSIDRTENTEIPNGKSNFPNGKFANTIQNNNTPSSMRETVTFGRFKNVFITPEEYEELKQLVPDADDLIERLSEGLESKGYMYDNHFATLLKWHREDKREQTPKTISKSTKTAQASQSSFDIEDFFQAALARTYGGVK